MKKIFILFSLSLSFIWSAQSQCIVDENNNILGTTPSSLGSLCVGKPVNQVVQFVLPNDTTINVPVLGNIVVKYDSAILSVTSIPPGLSYSCANNCKIYKTTNSGKYSRGCFTMTGTPTTATIGNSETIGLSAKLFFSGSSYSLNYNIETKILAANDPACQPNGLTNFNIGSSLTVYPNPSRGKANIELDLPNSTNVSIELYDVLGNNLGIIFSGRMNQGINTVSTDNLKFLDSGMYMIKVDLDTQKGTRTYTERMIVK